MSSTGFQSAASCAWAMARRWYREWRGHRWRGSATFRNGRARSSDAVAAPAPAPELAPAARPARSTSASLQQYATSLSIPMPNDDIKTRLTPEQFHMTQEKGTERAFTGKYWNCHDDGVYRCVVCSHPLFSSETKFESGSGWPSFFQPLDESAVTHRADDSTTACAAPR